MMATLGEQLKEVLERINPEHPEVFDELFAFYHPKMTFKDPTQALDGLDAFASMNLKALEKSDEYRMEVHDHSQSGEVIQVTWTLDYRPKKGPLLTFEGATVLRLEDGLIISQRDYWDLLSSVMNAIPIAGTLYRTLIAKLV